MSKQEVKNINGGYRFNTGGAAKYLGCSESLLTKLRVAGKGPRYIKRGGRVFYEKDDLDTYDRNCTVETADSRKAA